MDPGPVGRRSESPRCPQVDLARFALTECRLANSISRRSELYSRPGIQREVAVADEEQDEYIPTTEDQLLEQDGQMLIPDEPEA